MGPWQKKTWSIHDINQFSPSKAKNKKTLAPILSQELIRQLSKISIPSLDPLPMALPPGCQSKQTPLTSGSPSVSRHFHQNDKPNNPKWEGWGKLPFFSVASFLIAAIISTNEENCKFPRHCTGILRVVGVFIDSGSLIAGQRGARLIHDESELQRKRDGTCSHSHGRLARPGCMATWQDQS